MITKDREPISPDDMQYTLEGGDTFIETGSTFGDNFRFGGEALVKLAAIRDSAELNKAVQVIYDIIIHDKSEGDDLIDSLRIGIVHLAQLYKTFSQMAEAEAVIFIEQNRNILLRLNPSLEEWNRLAGNKDLPEAVAYNQDLRSTARAFLELNVTPWTVRGRT